MSSSHQPTIAHSASAPRCTMRNAAPGRFSVRAGCGRSVCADLTAAATSASSGRSPSAVMPVIFTAHPARSTMPSDWVRRGWYGTIGSSPDALISQLQAGHGGPPPRKGQGQCGPCPQGSRDIGTDVRAGAGSQVLTVYQLLDTHQL